MAITAILTILAGSYSSAKDLEPLCEAISRYETAHPQQSKGMSLKETYEPLAPAERRQLQLLGLLAGHLPP
jgi:hypothetical protein